MCPSPRVTAFTISAETSCRGNWASPFMERGLGSEVRSASSPRQRRGSGQGGANYLWSVALGDASMASPCERACDWALRAATMGGLSLAVGASLAANAAVAALAPQAWAAKMVHDWAPRTARQRFDASKVEPQALATTGFVVVARRECEAKASAWQAANVAVTWWAWTAQAAQAVATWRAWAALAWAVGRRWPFVASGLGAPMFGPRR